MSCIFCKIIEKELESKILYEDEKIIAFSDIKPFAPVHILIVPKKHIATVNDLTQSDKGLAGEMILVAQQIAKEKGLSEKGYRLVFNTGDDAGQTVDHLHLHLLAGKKLLWQ